MNKYIWQIGQIHFAIWTNTTGKFRQIKIFWAQVAVSDIRPRPLNLKRRPRSSLNFNEQIHLANWTNTFCNLDKYNWQIQTNTNVLWAQVAESHIRPLNLSRELKGAHALCNRFQWCLMIIIFWHTVMIILTWDWVQMFFYFN